MTELSDEERRRECLRVALELARQNGIDTDSPAFRGRVIMEAMAKHARTQ